MECREFINLVRAYWDASDQHARLRDSLDGSRGKLCVEDYRVLVAEVEAARLAMIRTSTNLALHLASHDCHEVSAVVTSRGSNRMDNATKK